MENFIEIVKGLDLKMIYVEGEMPFYLSERCITTRQWALVMEGDILQIHGSEGKENDRPVSGITYEQACAFCEKLSSFTGRRYTLPKESEWERARQLAEKDLPKKKRIPVESTAEGVFWEWCTNVEGEENEYCPCHAYPIGDEWNVTKQRPTYSADNLGFRVAMMI